MSADPRLVPTAALPVASSITGRAGYLSVTARRRLFLALTASLMAALIGLMVLTLSPGGYDALDLLLTLLFAMTLPWTVVGFLNAIIGLLVLRLAPDPELAVCPVHTPTADTPLRSSTAIAICIRDEDVTAVERNLEHMIQGLHRAGLDGHFHAYVLSDSSDETIAREERRVFTALAARWRGTLAVDYRRRDDNAGYKAGNIREFLQRWGQRHEFMLALDADSFMTAEAMARLVRIMEANPRLGILQSLINGMPATSLFARVFQFGMRLGMRSYTLGSAWWQGDCGPYWGHNALIRIAPFMAHCELPEIPGRGALRGTILSHDQVEAVLMRRAGYEVRVLADGRGSYEENPTTLPEFVRRDLRWCLGNMQYLHLLSLPGLPAVSRLQLLLAILMFAGSPAWMGFVALGAARVGTAADPSATFDTHLGIVLFACIMGMVFAPKITTVLDLALDRRARRGFGGMPRLLASVLGETLFSTLLAPVMAIAHTRFIAGLPFGFKATWAAQHRGVHRVALTQAWRRFWPQTLVGITAVVWFALYSAAPLWSVLPIALGPLLVMPFAMFTARAWSGRPGLWRIPEDDTPPDELARLLQAHGEHEPGPHAGAPARSSSGLIRAFSLGRFTGMAGPTTSNPLRSALQRARSLYGVARSLWIYYGNPRRTRAMDAFYRELVPAGALAFDIGSHVGDRTACFRRLGARVVAVEPQRAMVRTLSLLYRRDPAVTILEAAVGARDGEVELFLNTVNPTVSTASPEFIAAAAGAAGWREQRWTEAQRVPQVSLDTLIREYGEPAFVKIDVEGLEAEVLAGLSSPVPLLSFEFTTIQREVGLACLQRCGRLGDYRFNVALGETQRLVHARWLDADTMAGWIEALPHHANSGDIYARLADRVPGTDP